MSKDIIPQKEQNGKLYGPGDENDGRFYKLPKELFINEEYKDISIGARVLYSIILDRIELSRANSKNNTWVDEKGKLYCYFSRENLSELMNITLKTVTSFFNELQDHCLIKKVRQGCMKPDKIYITKIEGKSGESVDNSMKGKNYTSRGVKITLHEGKNLPPNDTELNETDFNETEETRRYITLASYATSSNCRELKYYNQAYKEYLGCDHPEVTEDQISDIVASFKDKGLSETYISDTELMKIITWHFEHIPENNNGKIQYFNSVLDRYLKDNYEEIMEMDIFNCSSFIASSGEGSQVDRGGVDADNGVPW